MSLMGWRVCVVYKAGFVGFLVAGVDGCDCRFYDPHRVPRLAWVLACQWLEGTKRDGWGVVPRSNPRK